MLIVRGCAKFSFGNLHFIQKNFAGIEGNAAQRRVANSAWLLKDFLEHEVLVAAFFRLDGIPGNALHLALDWLASKIHQSNSGRRQHGHIPIGHKVQIARVVQNAWHIGGHKVFAVAQAYHCRWPTARGNNRLRLVGR